jgi:hypothetical protein
MTTHFSSTFPLPDPSDPLTGGFWSHAQQRVLALPRCQACGAWCWYPRATCVACSGPWRWTPVGGHGRIFTFTIVHKAFLPAFADDIPFATGLVVLDDAEGIRLATRFSNIDLAAIEMDMPVTVRFEELRFAGVDGSMLAPVFEPRP